MNIFTVVCTLAALIYPTVCRRHHLVFYSEEMIDKSLIIMRNRKGPVLVDKAVDDNENLRIITVKPNENEDKGHAIYPTEPGKTVGVVPAKDKADVVAEQKTKIPESVLIAMNDVHSTDDFLRRFVALGPNYHYSKIPSSTASLGRSSLQITAFAGCKPQNTVVKLENPDGAGVLLWPPCVYLPRCGGCCTSELMTCRPTATSEVNVTVLHARYTGQQPNPFANEGVRIITMEQHNKCACGCKVLPENCTPLQEYRKDECRCVCSNESEALRCQKHANKLWDSHDCACQCRTIVDCSSAFYFNIKSCRCELLLLSLVPRIGTALVTDRNETEEAENITKIVGY